MRESLKKQRKKVLEGYILVRIYLSSTEVSLFQKMYLEKVNLHFEIIENLKLKENVSKIIYIRLFKLYQYVHMILTYFISKISREV